MGYRPETTTIVFRKLSSIKGPTVPKSLLIWVHPRWPSTSTTISDMLRAESVRQTVSYCVRCRPEARKKATRWFS